MKDVAKQFLSIWKELKVSHKALFIGILITIIIALFSLIFKPSSPRYVPLFSGVNFSYDTTEISAYLENAGIAFQHDKDKGILVPDEQTERVRGDLIHLGLLKNENANGRGFELFDTNTWIKGEKELQVLEMRALKGQLERDLSAFEQIKSANVILDIPPPRPLTGSQQYKTKASVILTLMPGVRLTNSTLRAILYHLTGAVRGLDSNRIAISDTSGKLYKAMVENEDEARLLDKQLQFEEVVEEKVTHLFNKILGEESFYISVAAHCDPALEKIPSLDLFVTIDASQHSEKELKDLLFDQLQLIVKSFNIEVSPFLSWIPFSKKSVPTDLQYTSSRYSGFLFLIVLPLLLILALSYFYWSKRKKTNHEEAIFHLMSRVDLDKLAYSMQDEDPETLALMVSYLKPERAEKLIAAFPSSLQESILLHLAEMEREV